MIRRTLFITLLIAMLAGLVPARAELCLIGCSLNTVAKAAPSVTHDCCNQPGMPALAETTSTDGGQRWPSDGCDHGLTCPGHNAPRDGWSGPLPSGPEPIAGPLPDFFVPIDRLDETFAVVLRPITPSPCRAPELYTRNCSLLI